MKTFINQSTIISKKNNLISNFRNNKRIRWTDFRNDHQFSFS
ncbi:hypothetical protein [uncultured Maribacter sp.]